MMKYVVDASVILKWIVGDEREPDHEKALRLLNDWVDDKVELLAPSLWEYEVGNFLGRQMPDQATEKMTLLINLRLAGTPLTERMYILCFAWMRENGVSFYDASYLAVAEEMQAKLITADEKFARKMSKTVSTCLLRDL